MKKNFNIDQNDVKGFTLNFLAVVLGIVITFSGEGLISSHNEKKEVNSSLELVKNELTDNIGYIHIADSLLTLYSQSATFMLAYMDRFEEAPEDSLDMYCQVPLTMMDISASEEALELLKTSSLFTKIKDQKLSLDIIHTYGKIDDRMKLYKMVFDNISKYREVAITGDVKALLSRDNVTSAMLWTTIMSTVEGRHFIRELQVVGLYANSNAEQAQIHETIDKIDKYVGNK